MNFRYLFLELPTLAQLMASFSRPEGVVPVTFKIVEWDQPPPLPLRDVELLDVHLSLIQRRQGLPFSNCQLYMAGMVQSGTASIPVHIYWDPAAKFGEILPSALR